MYIYIYIYQPIHISCDIILHIYIYIYIYDLSSDSNITSSKARIKLDGSMVVPQESWTNGYWRVPMKIIEVHPKAPRSPRTGHLTHSVTHLSALSLARATTTIPALDLQPGVSPSGMPQRLLTIWTLERQRWPGNTVGADGKRMKSQRDSVYITNS